MIKHSTTAVLILAAVLSVSCENDIEYKGDGGGHMMVVNASSIAGTPVSVEVTRSRFFLDSPSNRQILYDADVTIVHNGEQRTLSYDPEQELFMDSEIVREGDSVTVIVSHSNYGKATANDMVPYPSSITVEDSHVSSDSLWTVCLSINRNHSEPDNGLTHYYRLNLNAFANIILSLQSDDTAEYENEPDTISYWLDIRIPRPTAIKLGMASNFDYIEDFGDASDYVFSSGNLLFTDELFSEGDRLEFIIPMPHAEEYDYSYWGWNPDIVDYICNITFETLTEQSYRYIKSVEDYDSNDFAIFQEPITIMGNFNGALGNLFSSSSQTISIRQ